MKKYHFVYETTCKINGKTYIGVHGTDNIDDNYIGSGKLLKRAIAKYGRDQFERKILLMCSSENEMYDKEDTFLTKEYLSSAMTYNLASGGKLGRGSLGTVPVVLSDGSVIRVRTNDQRYVSGELKHNLYGKVHVTDQSGDRFYVTKGDVRFQTGEIWSTQRGKRLAFDTIDGKWMMVVMTEWKDYYLTPTQVTAGTEKAKQRGKKISAALKGQPQTGARAKGAKKGAKTRTGRKRVVDSNGVVSWVQADDLRIGIDYFIFKTTNKSSPISRYVYRHSDGTEIIVDGNKNIKRDYGFSPIKTIGDSRCGWTLISREPLRFIDL